MLLESIEGLVQGLWEGPVLVVAVLNIGEDVDLPHGLHGSSLKLSWGEEGGVVSTELSNGGEGEHLSTVSKLN